MRRTQAGKANKEESVEDRPELRFRITKAHRDTQLGCCRGGTHSVDKTSERVCLFPLEIGLLSGKIVVADYLSLIYSLICVFNIHISLCCLSTGRSTRQKFLRLGLKDFSIKR